MKPSILLAILSIPLSGFPASAQIPEDTTYKVELTATVSPMFNLFRYQKAPTLSSTTSLGYGVSVRGMWHPGQLLSVGVLSGYFMIARDEIEIPGASAHLHYRAELSAIPLQLALSMQSSRVEVGIGVGPYLMLTSVSGGNNPASRGNRLEIGMTFFGSYLFSLGGRFRIGPELRILYFRYRGIVSIMPSCSVRFDLVRY